MRISGRTLMVATALLLCTGCAGMTAPGQKTTARKPPQVNLAGFPKAYKEGYVDACDSSKDNKRYKTDQQYKQGWQDGGFACKKTAASSAKSRTAWAGTE